MRIGALDTSTWSTSRGLSDTVNSSSPPSSPVMYIFGILVAHRAAFTPRLTVSKRLPPHSKIWGKRLRSKNQSKKQNKKTAKKLSNLSRWSSWLSWVVGWGGTFFLNNVNFKDTKHLFNENNFSVLYQWDLKKSKIIKLSFYVIEINTEAFRSYWKLTPQITVHHHYFNIRFFHNLVCS